jgi:hypothetical protein
MDWHGAPSGPIASKPDENKNIVIRLITTRLRLEMNLKRASHSNVLKNIF